MWHHILGLDTYSIAQHVAGIEAHIEDGIWKLSGAIPTNLSTSPYFFSPPDGQPTLPALGAGMTDPNPLAINC
jgi:hypothetical protein